MVHTPQRTADSLLSALDPLPYPLRMRELALRVRETSPLRPVLDVLEARGPYERGVAVVAASVARDAEWIAARIADLDPYVRGHALRVAESLQVPDSAYESALQDASEVVRRELLRAVVAGRRTALADRLVDGLRRDWGDAEAARLLPGCSPATVARLLPGLFHAVTGWKAFAKRHPGALLDVTERELTALPESLRDTWWGRYTPALAAVAHREPSRVLDLAERFGPADAARQLRPLLGDFARTDPARLLRLLLTPDWHAAPMLYSPSPTVLRRLARSGAPELPAYGRLLAERGKLDTLLKALPPARRYSLYQAVGEGRGGAHSGIDEPVLEALPRSCVAEEARAMGAVARKRGSQGIWLLLADSFLPVAEVRERLVEATRHPAADDRATAWPLLIRNAGRSGDPAAVTAALEEMARLRNEQDPVRSAALGALGRLRPALFTEDAEPHLDRIAVDAVQAPDSSPYTRELLSRIAISVLREHAAGGSRELVNWSLRTLVRISGSTGDADLGRLDLTLRRGQEHQVYEALRPWIEAGAEKADYSLAFALARAVGRRAAGMPELQELLWQAIRYGTDATARTAVELWLEPHTTRDERVARILALEPSAGALAPVLKVVTRRRTDLLDALLAETPPYGRFLSKDMNGTVPVDRDARRWVPRQHRALARQLEAIADDTGRPVYDRADALGPAARIPLLGADLVRRWTGDEDVVLQEAALAALAHTDRPAETVPELLAHAGDEQARVAVYAATFASRHAAPSVLAGQLRELLLSPDAKVTSRKEAARLAARRLPVPSAAALLTEVYARPGTHLDVRAACVAFAGGLLAEEPVWELLRDAAVAEPVLRGAVLRVSPFDLPDPHRERYARLVRDVTTTDDPDTAALAFTALAHWAPWSPDAPTVLATAATNLTDRVSWRSAANGLVTAATGSPRGVEGLLGAIRELAEAELAAGEADPEDRSARGDRASEWTAAETSDSGVDAAVRRTGVELLGAGASASADAEEFRDRPARRRIDHLVARLAEHARGAAGSIRSGALAASEVLARYDAFVPQAAEIAVFHLDLDAEPERLDRLAALFEGRPALAARTAGELRDRLRRQAHEGDPGTLLEVARRLTAHGGHGQGLLAAALTDAMGSRTAWAVPWREQLRAVRRHPVADVRDAALDQVTAYE